MLKLDVDPPRTLETFNEDQRNNREQLSNQINRIEKDIVRLLKESCKDSLQHFYDVNRISINNKNEPTADENEEPEPFLVGDQIHKSMPYT